MRILLIEDEHPTIFLVEAHVAKVPHWVVDSRRSLQEGREAYNDAIPDTILLDLGMPQSTIAQVLAAIPKFNESAVIVLTGNEDKEIEEAAMANGASAFLSKDLLHKPEAFIKAIRDGVNKFLLKNRRTEEDARRLIKEIDEADMLLIRRIPGIEEKVDSLAEKFYTFTGKIEGALAGILAGQVITHDHQAATREQLNRQDDRLATGAETMKRIDATTQQTNGKVKVLRTEMDATKEDVAVVMAERKVRIIDEETQKIKAAVTKGFMLIRKPTWKELCAVGGALIGLITFLIQLRELWK